MAALWAGAGLRSAILALLAQLRFGPAVLVGLIDLVIERQVSRCPPLKTAALLSLCKYSGEREGLAPRPPSPLGMI